MEACRRPANASGRHLPDGNLGEVVADSSRRRAAVVKGNLEALLAKRQPQHVGPHEPHGWMPPVSPVEGHGGAVDANGQRDAVVGEVGEFGASPQPRSRARLGAPSQPSSSAATSSGVGDDECQNVERRSGTARRGRSSARRPKDSPHDPACGAASGVIRVRCCNDPSIPAGEEQEEGRGVAPRVEGPGRPGQRVRGNVLLARTPRSRCPGSARTRGPPCETARRSAQRVYPGIGHGLGRARVLRSNAGVLASAKPVGNEEAPGQLPNHSPQRSPGSSADRATAS
jgi:hypothetical protein